MEGIILICILEIGCETGDHIQLSQVLVWLKAVVNRI